MQKKYVIETDNDIKLIREVATGHEIAYEDDPKLQTSLERYCKILNRGATGFNGWTPSYVLNAFENFKNEDQRLG